MKIQCSLPLAILLLIASQTVNYAQGIKTSFPKYELKALYLDSVMVLPKPNVTLFIGSSTQPHQSSIEVSKTALDKIRFSVSIEDSLARSVPQDSQYKVSYAEISLARGKKLVSKTLKSTSEVVVLEDLMKLAEAGDRLIIEVRKIDRLDHTGKWQEVNSGSTIFVILIN